MQRTLDSILVQEKHPSNHFFIDCDSIDNTLEIIEKYKIKNSHINIIKITQTSSGIYKAWNEALSFLLGIVNINDYISIINSDDWFVNDYIKTISEYEGYDLIAGSCKAYFKNYNLIRPCRNLKLLPLFMSVIDPSLSVRASVYREIGLYRERFKVASDHDFIYRAYEMGCKFKILKEVLINVEMGGFAYQNRNQGFVEQLKLTRERCVFPIPELAFLYRKFKFPRLRLLDFL